MIPEVRFKQGDVFLFRVAYWVLAVVVLYPALAVALVLLGILFASFSLAGGVIVASLAIPVGFWNETARLLGNEHLMLKDRLPRKGEG